MLRGRPPTMGGRACGASYQGHHGRGARQNCGHSNNSWTPAYGLGGLGRAAVRRSEAIGPALHADQDRPSPANPVEGAHWSGAGYASQFCRPKSKQDVEARQKKKILASPESGTAPRTISARTCCGRSLAYNTSLSGRPPIVGGRAVVAMLSQGGRGAARGRPAADQTIVRQRSRELGCPGS